jgi:RNA chaperone Hfq
VPGNLAHWPANRRGSAKDKNNGGTIAKSSGPVPEFSSQKQKPTHHLPINGVKLTGVVTSFDNFCVLLRRDGHSQLVYKHAISTIMPSQPVQMFDGEESQGA